MCVEGGGLLVVGAALLMVKEGGRKESEAPYRGSPKQFLSVTW
jgi:hypothetical protein